MRLITYSQGPAGLPRVAVRVGHRVLDIEAASRVDGEPLPSTMKTLLREGRGALSRVQALAKAAQSSAGRFAGAMLEERAIRFLPPVPDAERFVCLGENGSLLVGHNAKVARPAGVTRLDCEPELVFVIGRRASSLGADAEAEDYVIGVTLLNGLNDRDTPGQEGASASRALGPEIVTLDELDPGDLWITCAVNGDERSRGNTHDQLSKMTELLVQLSRTTPFEPGDMFSIGPPDHPALGNGNAKDVFLKPGDVVDCSIEGVTTLRTTIVAPA